MSVYIFSDLDHLWHFFDCSSPSLHSEPRAGPHDDFTIPGFDPYYDEASLFYKFCHFIVNTYFTFSSHIHSSPLPAPHTFGSYASGSSSDLTLGHSRYLVRFYWLSSHLTFTLSHSASLVGPSTSGLPPHSSTPGPKKPRKSRVNNAKEAARRANKKAEAIKPKKKDEDFPCLVDGCIVIREQSGERQMATTCKRRTSKWSWLQAELVGLFSPSSYISDWHSTFRPLTCQSCKYTFDRVRPLSLSLTYLADIII